MAKRRRKLKLNPNLKSMNDPLLDNFIIERNLADSTQQGYRSTLLKYFQYTGFNSIQEMIDEAEKEETERVPLKKSKLKKRLLGYRTHLLENMDNTNTIKTYMAKLITIYNHYEIRVPQLPKMKITKTYQVSYYDLPNKEHIQKALDYSEAPLKALILFMSSSGTAKAETLSITVKMFLKSLRGESDKTSLSEIIDDLVDRRDLVPIIYLKRIKTDKYYYTCCSPEATHYILLYLQQRIHDKNKPLTTEDEAVFPWLGSYIMKKFQRINDNLGFGYVGKYRFFRTHTMRKFHASNLGTSAEIIDELEGRSKNTVHETYIKTKPDKLRLTYMEYMHNVMINTEDYIGPHLGGKSEKKKLKDAIVELVPEITHMPTSDATPMIQNQQVPGDVYMMLGRLEQRIIQLEDEVRRLKGG